MIRGIPKNSSSIRSKPSGPDFGSVTLYVKGSWSSKGPLAYANTAGGEVKLGIAVLLRVARINFEPGQSNSGCVNESIKNYLFYHV